MIINLEFVYANFVTVGTVKENVNNITKVLINSANKNWNGQVHTTKNSINRILNH